jgi:band 4.1-like protein 1/2/3
LILNYADIDPSHFGKDVALTKETVPITREQFYEGIKGIGKSVASATPTVVKTTTKQVITKNDDGLTHNVEEEVKNLGTGEITFSTQEHKVIISRFVILIHKENNIYVYYHISYTYLIC